MTSLISSAPIVVVKLPTTNLAIIVYAKEVHDAMVGNPQFSKPTVDLPTFLADIVAFSDAEGKVASGGKGVVAQRNARKAKVVATIHHLADYVQGEAEAQPTVAEAVALIESAHFSVRKPVTRNKPELEARHVPEIPGAVQLIALAVSTRATYYWEFSLDQQTWLRAPDTLKASTVITGLQSAKTYFFRFRALTPTGPKDYSPVVPLVVH
jgi:hypothetical protein